MTKINVTELQLVVRSVYGNDYLSLRLSAWNHYVLAFMHCVGQLHGCHYRRYHGSLAGDVVQRSLSCIELGIRRDAVASECNLGHDAVTSVGTLDVSDPHSCKGMLHYDCSISAVLAHRHRNAVHEIRLHQRICLYRYGSNVITGAGIRIIRESGTCLG